jgi:hypothetical protein
MPERSGVIGKIIEGALRDASQRPDQTMTMSVLRDSLLRLCRDQLPEPLVQALVDRIDDALDYDIPDGWTETVVQASHVAGSHIAERRRERQ